MNNEETVEINIKLPKAIIDFLRANAENVEKYLTYSIIEAVRSDIDCGEIFPGERSKLTQIFREHGIAA